ncbi:MAG: RidA family protein [Halobacteria archaeon]|nr:RidA family protein [Halobacteria archaeon]
MTREVINPDGLIDSTETGYSQAIVEDGTFYMSGQVGWDENFNVVGEDMESQARKAFENIGVLLDEVDKDFEDIAKVTAHLVNPHDNLDEYLRVWNEFFDDEPYPCHTILGVHQLALEDFLIEIEVEVPLEGD